MKRIQLHGKYAVGEHAFALVDDDLFDALNAYKWKAKPNGSGCNTYAIRVEKDLAGVSRDVRMHRVVLGYSGDLDTDHRDHNSLNNQRSNLRVATRSENQLNRAPVYVQVACASCGGGPRLTKRGSEGVVKCRSAGCQNALSHYAPRSAVAFNVCEECGAHFTAERRDGKYCSNRCKCKARYAKNKEAGTLPPSFSIAAERSRLWRQARRAVPTSP